MVQLLKSIRHLKSVCPVNRDRWPSLRSLRSVVFVGSSCAGKSTIIDAIRQMQDLASLGVTVPVRYVTRPSRQADNFMENCHVTLEQFHARVRRGEIGLNWVRKMEGGREEQYGFAAVPAAQLALYSPHKCIYDNPPNIQPTKAVNDALFVWVFCPDSG